MRGIAACVLILVFPFAVGPAQRTGEQDDALHILAEHSAAAAEYALAKDSQVYFNIGISENRINLKAKGTVLRSWAVSGTKFWGAPGLPKTVELVRKSALEAPQRFVIEPGGGEEAEEAAAEAEFEVEALEIDDMPRHFVLYFDGGLSVSIRARSRGLKSGLSGLMDFLRWYVVVPLRNLEKTVRGKPMSFLELTFAEARDAQAVYWIFFEGIKGRIQY